MSAFKHSAVGFGTPDIPPPSWGRSIGPISLHNAIGWYAVPKLDSFAAGLLDPISRVKHWHGRVLPSGRAQGRVEDGGERDRQPEVEQAVPENRYRGLRADPKQGEGSGDGGLEDPYAPRRQRYRRQGGRHPVGYEKYQRVGRHVHGCEHQDEAQGVEGPVA